MVQNSDKVGYYELKIYMHSSYINVKDHCHKTLLAALNVLVNWKWEKRPPAQHCESIKGVSLTTKVNPSGFGDTAKIVGSPGIWPRTVLNPGNKNAKSPARQEKTPRSRST